jgi:hypothetical protein
MMSSHFVPLCFLCGSQAPLETCKADEYGRPVHEECYVARLIMHGRATPTKRLPSQTKPREWPEFERWQAAAAMTMTAQPEKRFPLQMSRRRAEVAVVVAAIAVACLIAYSGRRPSLPGASTLQRSIAAPAMRLHANRTSTPQARPLREEAKAANPAFTQVQVGENEVDYVTDDVTVRYFTYNPGVHRVRAGYRQFDIGEDVTVRYFQHAAAVASATRPASNRAHPEEPSLPGTGKPGSSKLAR